MTRLVIFGGGRMGEALLTGLVTTGWATAGDLAVVEPSTVRSKELTVQFPGLTVSPTAVEADGAILATKPAIAPAAAAQLSKVSNGTTPVLSIAAGVTIATIEAALPPHTPVIRAMPNTPALVGAAATAISGGSSAGESDLDWATGLLESVGTVVRVAEAKLDAVTGLSGSGPAYVFLVAESLVEAGVLNGLDRATAHELAAQTLLGSARLLVETGESAASLRAAVTSPGGTTAAGLHVLERAGVRAAILEAVTAATARSVELGQS